MRKVEHGAVVGDLRTTGERVQHLACLGPVHLGDGAHQGHVLPNEIFEHGWSRLPCHPPTGLPVALGIRLRLSSDIAERLAAFYEGEMKGLVRAY